MLALLELIVHAMKHGERRRSGRKNLSQDFERLSLAVAIANDLTRSEDVSILCGGSLDQLPQHFARLDTLERSHSLPTLSPTGDQSCAGER